MPYNDAFLVRGSLIQGIGRPTQGEKLEQAQNGNEKECMNLDE